MKKYALMHKVSNEVISIVHTYSMEDAIEIFSINKKIAKYDLVEIYDIDIYKYIE